MFVSDLFYERTKKHYVFNITAISNIPSIIENGILCYDAVKRTPHSSIAIDTVQARRERVLVSNETRLHCYANLYFDYNNPMLYRRKDMAEEICVLAVKASILNVNGCVVSDRNAATDLVKFYSASDGIGEINFEKVYAQYWTHENPFEQANHKAIKCAEILVPNHVPYEYIVGAYVVSCEARDTLKEKGFDKKIVVNSGVFYRHR